ncbi:MAG: DUF3795 domain-containing protein [Candidatus Cloacimonetes bacterium]|nr:DUF3795 domain-containing protein [Candidatus Cloacimonadota bacterium]
MKEKEKLLAYCGLYCGDCAGHSGEIAHAARILLNLLKKYKFKLTARHMFHEEIHDYDEFIDTLSFMANLICPRICRLRDKSNCSIWACCRERGFIACYQCNEFENCEKLQSMEDLHGDSCQINLRSIRRLGLAEWIRKGKRHWFGSDIDGKPDKS